MRIIVWRGKVIHWSVGEWSNLGSPGPGRPAGVYDYHPLDHCEATHGAVLDPRRVLGSGGRDFRCGDCWLSKIAAGGRTGHGERVAAAAASAWGVVVVECVDQSDGSESVRD